MTAQEEEPALTTPTKPPVPYWSVDHSTPHASGQSEAGADVGRPRETAQRTAAARALSPGTPRCTPWCTATPPRRSPRPVHWNRRSCRLRPSSTSARSVGVARRSAHAIEQTGGIRLGLEAAEQQSPQVMQALLDVPAAPPGHRRRCADRRRSRRCRGRWRQVAHRQRVHRYGRLLRVDV